MLWRVRSGEVAAIPGLIPGIIMAGTLMTRIAVPNIITTWSTVRPMRIAVACVTDAASDRRHPIAVVSDKGLADPMNKKSSKTKSTPHARKQPPKSRVKASPGSTRAAVPAEAGQFGGIVAKSLELAQASINLGLNLVQKFGTSVQGDLLNRIANAGKSVFSAQGPAAESHGGAAQPGPQENVPASPAAITNRLPLFPGSPVRIPFSINNDAPEETKIVRLHLEEFTGELTGAALKAEHFSISPARKEISPMDFEKFEITGTLPVNCRSDAYWGAITVTGTESMAIPVKLVVMSRT
jgi:hypothetical protein